MEHPNEMIYVQICTHDCHAQLYNYLKNLLSSSLSTKILQTKIWNLYINLVAAILAENSIVTKDLEVKRLLERSPEKIVTRFIAADIIFYYILLLNH